MATSDVEIINQALVKLGARVINSLSEDTKPSRIAATTYAHLRDSVMEAHPWNFAMKRALLAADIDAPAWGSSLQFTLPADCLRVWKAMNLDKYKVEGGKLIPGTYEDRYNMYTTLSVTVENPLRITYISQVTTPSSYTNLFIETLAARLAMEWAVTLTADSKYYDTFAALYFNKLAEARSLDSQESIPDDVYADDFNRSRLD